MTEYRVPLIDPQTGDDWDEVVEADSPMDALQAAMEQTDGVNNGYHVSSTFVRKHELAPEDAL